MTIPWTKPRSSEATTRAPAGVRARPAGLSPAIMRTTQSVATGLRAPSSSRTPRTRQQRPAQGNRVRLPTRLDPVAHEVVRIGIYLPVVLDQEDGEVQVARGRTGQGEVEHDHAITQADVRESQVGVRERRAGLSEQGREVSWLGMDRAHRVPQRRIDNGIEPRPGLQGQPGKRIGAARVRAHGVRGEEGQVALDRHAVSRGTPANASCRSAIAARIRRQSERDTGSPSRSRLAEASRMTMRHSPSLQSVATIAVSMDAGIRP